MQIPETVETAPATAPGVAVSENDDELIESDLLVEEISIDGMCGVY